MPCVGARVRVSLGLKYAGLGECVEHAHVFNYVGVGLDEDHGAAHENVEWKPCLIYEVKQKICYHCPLLRLLAGQLKLGVHHVRAQDQRDGDQAEGEEREHAFAVLQVVEVVVLAHPIRHPPVYEAKDQNHHHVHAHEAEVHIRHQCLHLQNVKDLQCALKQNLYQGPESKLAFKSFLAGDKSRLPRLKMMFCWS